MMINRVLLVLMLISSASVAQARFRPKATITALTEAAHEAAEPSYSGQIREARRITAFLVDALVLTNTQGHALQAYTVAERKALALAINSTDAAQAQWEYRLAVHGLLAASQRKSYVALCQQLAGTVLPLNGTELAFR